MRTEPNALVFENGQRRRVYAHAEIVGMSATGILEASEGYDGALEPLSSVERVELARHMIGRWVRYWFQATRDSWAGAA